MTRRVVATLALALIGAAALPMSNAYACSCAGPPADGIRPLTSTVFYGDILRREVKGYEATYVVEVKRVYAGRTGPVAEVRTQSSGAACGLELPPSGPAVFYARNDDDGGLTGMLCDGSRTAYDGPPAKLGEGYPPTGSAASPTASASGSPAGQPSSAGAASTAPHAADPPAADPPTADPDRDGVVPVAAAAVTVLGAAAVAIPRRRP